jgi:hypothetical protein
MHDLDEIVKAEIVAFRDIGKISLMQFVYDNGFLPFLDRHS